MVERQILAVSFYQNPNNRLVFSQDIIMKNAILTGIAALATGVVGHSTWQELWVDGKDQAGVCARLPVSNSPVTSVTSNDIRCNANQGFAAQKCSVAAGGTVTIEMHAQPNDRSCANEALGGAHYGPVLAYMSKVDDSATADGSSPFFKIYQDTWAKLSSTSQGSDDYWGTKDLNTNCGKMDVKIPTDLAPGDYLLRAEAIALHSASSAGGAQFYMTCYQLTVTGSGTSNPAGVSFPGAYAEADPGIQINIYQQLSTYVAPGPAVVTGGTEAVAGKAGSVVTATGGASQPTASASASAPASASTSASASVAKVVVSSTMQTVVKPTTTSGAGACTSVAKYGQCGGDASFTGCTTCVSGSTCSVLNAYYSQCL
ncbi:carbohydrate-binding module family 1 protein [Pleomassaria siparia CBS 279.74]|uniref:AA9 family lytic polysaccharide monooxygenase n=1 Tax=Pleomassaria siparia CBS 279.74 TaxID=1314801 RepID=A0A6G1K3T2_9PLEO|nr:carbohydrate-binding module family 1 protein [Pleomassaria siparia CBS 279.74]